MEAGSKLRQPPHVNTTTYLWGWGRAETAPTPPMIRYSIFAMAIKAYTDRPTPGGGELDAMPTPPTRCSIFVVFYDTIFFLYVGTIVP